MHKNVLDLAGRLRYEHRSVATVDTLQRPGSPFMLGLENTADGSVLPYIYVRTSSWTWPGERSDLNDILSTSLAVCLRIAIATSCRFVEDSHPAVDVPGELYARFLIPEQPFTTGFTSGHDTSTELERLLNGLVWSEQMSLMMLHLCDAEHNVEGTYEARRDTLDVWATRVQQALGQDQVTGSDATYNSRTKPTWWYYRSASGTAVVRSEDLASVFTAMADSESERSVLRAGRGLLIRSRGLCNYLPESVERRVRRLIHLLEGHGTDEVSLITLENKTVAASRSHCVFLPSDTGKRAFDRRIDALRQKHTTEARFLFEDTPLTWAEEVPGDRFQSLACDLLARERGVSRLRPVGASTERDGGRDYLIEWTTPLLPHERPVEGRQLPVEQRPPSRTRRVVVQCKADRSAVGRKQVTGVYDTMKHYGVDGYLLIVRSRLTAPLVDLLDRIRAEPGLFADWWELPQVEERLRANPDLLERYNDIVRGPYMSCMGATGRGDPDLHQG